MKGLREALDGVFALVPPVDGRLVRPRRVDLLLSLGLIAAAVTEFAFDTPIFPGLVLVSGLILAVAVAYRRVSPLLVVLVATAVPVGFDTIAAITDKPLLGSVAGGLAVVTIVYSVGRWAPRRTVAIAVVLVVFVISAAGFLNPENDPAWAWFLLEVALGTAVIAVGLVVRSRDALKTERARAELAEERSELANEVHDSVAHHMSAIAVRAEGALHLVDPDERTEALNAIKESASAGLSDVRRLVSSMRRADDMPRPLPGLGDLNQLAGEASTPSLDVEVVIEAAAEVVPVTVSAVVYGIAREALTNVRRHSIGATRATVRAHKTGQYLDLTITDDGSIPTTRPTEPGIGLKVMTERANSVGGSLSAGPNPSGGWLVAARLPIGTEIGS
ncbi:MAG: sensor histidine kinase [Acidimicrobiales bacterium]